MHTCTHTHSHTHTHTHSIYIYIYIYTNLISTSIHRVPEKKEKKAARNKR